MEDKWITNADIENMTRHHPPSRPEIIAAHEQIRNEFCNLMISMNALLPECSDKTRAIDAMRDAMQACNTVIAVQQKTYDIQRGYPWQKKKSGTSES